MVIENCYFVMILIQVRGGEAGGGEKGGGERGGGGGEEEEPAVAEVEMREVSVLLDLVVQRLVQHLEETIFPQAIKSKSI